MPTATTGFHRVSNVTTRASYGLDQQIVPGASILVTLSATGAAAPIYSDPGMSVAVSGSLLFADVSGSYDYFVALNSMVDETISSPNGEVLIITNIGANGAQAVSFTTSSTTFDIVAVPGALSTSHVGLTATNLIAAGMIASTYISTKSAGSITVTHPATPGGTFDLLVTPY